MKLRQNELDSSFVARKVCCTNVYFTFIHHLLVKLRTVVVFFYSRALSQASLKYKWGATFCSLLCTVAKYSLLFTRFKTFLFLIAKITTAYWNVTCFFFFVPKLAYYSQFITSRQRLTRIIFALLAFCAILVKNWISNENQRVNSIKSKEWTQSKAKSELGKKERVSSIKSKK